MKTEKLKKEKAKAPKSILKSVYLVLVVILAISFITLWIMDSSKYNKLEKASLEEQQLLKKTSIEEQNLLIAKSDQIIKNRDELSLKLLMKPLVWAIRAEMLRDNMEQVNQYAYNMVKEKNFELVMIVSTTGEIISATDKKLEGTQFSVNYDNAFLNKNEIMTKSTGSNIIVISAPVMGYDNRLGTVFIKYTPTKYELKAPAIMKDSLQ